MRTERKPRKASWQSNIGGLYVAELQSDLHENLEAASGPSTCTSFSTAHSSTKIGYMRDYVHVRETSDVRSLPVRSLLFPLQTQHHDEENNYV